MASSTPVRRGKPLPGELSLPAIAKALGVSRSVCQRYAEKGMPRTSIQAAAKWRKENIRTECIPPARSRTNTGNAGQPQTLNEARLAILIEQTKREAEQSEKLRIQNAVKRGQLIERSTVELETRLAISHIKSKLEGLPHAVANVVPSESKSTVIQAVTETVRLALKRLSDSLLEIQPEEDSE